MPVDPSKAGYSCQSIFRSEGDLAFVFCRWLSLRIPLNYLNFKTRIRPGRVCESCWKLDVDGTVV